MTGHLSTVEFRGDTLFAVREGDGVLIALKPISDRLGLDWSAQLKRTKRDPVLSEGMAIMAMPSPGGVQDAAALPLHLLPGWLFGIGANQVRSESREIVLAYQRECHGALFAYFFGPRDERHLLVADAGPAREEPMRVRRQLVTEARQTFGTRAAGALWFALGLPVVPEMRASSDQGSFGFTYTARPVAQPGGQ